MILTEYDKEWIIASCKDEGRWERYERNFKLGCIEGYAMAAAAVSKNLGLSIDDAMRAIGVAPNDLEQCRKMIEALKKG